MEQSNRYLEEEKLSKLMLTFSIPCVLSMLVGALYNIVDQIFIGNSSVGTIGITATSVVFPLITISMAFGLMLGDGTASYMSLCMGKRESDKIGKAVGTSITTAIIIGLLFWIIGFSSLDSILNFLGAKTSESLATSHEYAFWILIGLPFTILGTSLTPIVRADGSPKIAMVSGLTGCLLNIVLDYIFIFPMNMGVAGAAIATSIDNIFSFFIVLWYLFHTKTFKLKENDFKPQFSAISQICKLGFSSFLTQLSIVIITVVSMNMLAKYGALSKYGANDPQAIIGVVMKVFTIAVNLAVGVSAGCQPILGFNFGARRYDRVKKLFKMIMVCVLVIGILSTIAFQTIPRPIVSIFGANSANPNLYLEFGERALRIYLLLIIFTLLQKSIAIFLQATGSAVKATILSLIRDVIAFVPFTLLLPTSMGLDGILWAAPCADIIGIIFAIFFVILEFKRMNKLCVNATSKEIISDTVIKPSHPGVIVTIAREHGSSGKQIGRLVAEKLNIPFYYKETTALAAEESGLSKEFISDLNKNAPEYLHDLYLSTKVIQDAVVAQEKVIQKIADNGSCVIVGRAADYVLKEYPNLVRIFIYAPEEYRTKKVMEVYGDIEEVAKKNIHHSDEARSAYYKNISGNNWRDYKNYDLMVDSSIGTKESAEIITQYIKSRTSK